MAFRYVGGIRTRRDSRSFPPSPPDTERNSSMDASDSIADLPHSPTYTTPLHRKRQSLTGAIPRPKNLLVIVIPPPFLPHSPTPKQMAGYSQASGRFNDGVLLSLAPSLHGQLAAIAREFALPSVGGIVLHLVMDDWNIKPRLTEEAWTTMFAGVSEPVTLALPVIAKIEFDIDMRKATWYAEWAETCQAVPSRPGTRRLDSLPFALETAKHSQRISIPHPGDPTELVLPPPSQSWPVTPESPYRLPSASLEDRLFPSTPQRAPAPSFASHLTTKYRGFDREIVAIEQATDIKVRSLAECSEITPSLGGSLVQQQQVSILQTAAQSLPEERRRYPYSLSHIYPAVYPHFCLYPELSSLTRLAPNDGFTRGSEKYSSSASTSLQTKPTSLRIQSYPHHLSQIYPPVYPNFALYPATAQQPIPYRNSRWLTVHLHGAYPFNLGTIYAARYPHFDIYPALPGAASINRQSRPKSTPSPLKLVPGDLHPSSPISPSPLSPMRLPSADLSSRLQMSASPTRALFAQRYSRLPPLQYPRYLPQSPRSPIGNPLVESDPAALAGMKPIWEASLPSPAIMEEQEEDEILAPPKPAFFNSERAEIDIPMIVTPPPEDIDSSSDASSDYPDPFADDPENNCVIHDPSQHDISIQGLAYLEDNDSQYAPMPESLSPQSIQFSDLNNIPTPNSFVEGFERVLVPRRNSIADRASIASSIASNTPLNPEPILFSFKTSSEVSEALAHFVFEAYQQSIDKRGWFHVALSGGSLASLLTQGIVEAAKERSIDWSKWLFYFTDERAVPLGHADSNYKAYSHLFASLPIEPSQILHVDHRPDSPLKFIAEEYEHRLFESLKVHSYTPEQDVAAPKIDLVLLGMGSDGHTASLFPSHSLLQEKDFYVGCLSDSPKPPNQRITFTLPLINAARRVAFVCTGAEKAPMLARALVEDSPDVPASLVKLPYRPIVWFADEVACQNTSFQRSAFWVEDDAQSDQ